ncbi:hypothetical protein E4N62_42300 [Streptomyces sp. MNU76]|uniref:hypothetical protein n=1 Tax=Streptomyces sp. MNU76 TaxID=2560026 RepID=UPI001E35E00E|nr:hypothetical protein [Streptomyces sp. MNU76]MCC9711276.1 hypothetical protein [Streptomyces sp. MNU76]
MPYELNAVVGRFDLLRSETAGMRDADVVPLRRGVGLVPVTPHLLAEPMLRDWSRGGPIAHVEADFHGGVGHQSAAVWRAGAKVWGPAHTRDFTGPREEWPINAALALIDVVVEGSEEAAPHDLFQELGLGREQDMDGWRSAGRTARWAATYEATRHLQDLCLARGPLSREEAETLLRTWAAEQDAGAVTAELTCCVTRRNQSRPSGVYFLPRSLFLLRPRGLGAF